MRTFLRFLRLALLLFGFWVVLSGELDAVHLGAGAAAALAVAAASCRRAPSAGFPLLRFAAFLPWLLLQVLLSNLRVAGLVFSRRPLRPRFVRAVPADDRDAALAVAGCAITLTPGTVAVEARPGELLVHALDPASAREIEEGALARRVARVFGGGRP